ncbi:MAG: hypothetical protein WBC93_12930 [Sulfitobacter sp.]
MKKTSALTGLILMAQSAAADPSGFEASIDLSYNPNLIVTARGGTLGGLMAALGLAQSATSSTAKLGTTIRYETNTVAGAQNAIIAGYPQAITSASITMGTIDLQLDIPLVRANAPSSKIGLMANYEGWFCVDAEHCQMIGTVNAPWGMQGIALNNGQHTLLDETGATNSSNDVFGFQMGRTAARGEFTPALATTGFGTVSVDGFMVGIISRPSGRMLSGLSLPPITALVGTQEIGRSESWLYLEGDQLNGIVKVEGTIGQISVLP